ncbi:mitochondrial import receptor subunit TOM22 homolog isoform X3 [Petromyzon marinus]|uniref:mitochondrial import receptor subunit TOM22 homolog isoform X3 n=1 Tax=Petromyzon marinus TaxID=7757 RepID=UPI003F6F433B
MTTSTRTSQSTRGTCWVCPVTSCQRAFDTSRGLKMEESLWERLCALSEMFPPRLLSSFSSAQRSASSVTASLYTLGRSLLWVSTTSFMILVLPVVFETEKLQLEQQQLQQQRQILLGPSAGVSGGILPPPKT